MPDDTQLQRAIANVLWPHLRQPNNGFTAYRELRSLTPLNRNRGYSPSQIPGPEPTVEIISITYKIVTTLWSDDWPGRTSWRVTLNREHANRALSRLNAAIIADYELALEHSACRKPFTVETTPAGQKRLTRNRNDGLITHLTVAALEAIARATEKRLIPPEVEAALLTDDDPISLSAIEAALQLAGERET